MKKSLYSLFVTAIVSVTVVCAHAGEAVSEAIVVKVQNGAQATLPGQTQAVALKVGDKLPQGTVIQTPGNSEVDIQVFSGAVSTIKAGSKADLSKLSLTTANGVITKQSAIINLSLGSVVSNLDETKKAINDYSIRTPKGVAAARGTIYIVYVLSDGSSITYVARGSVTFINQTTGKSVTVNAGFAVKVDAAGNIGAPDTSLGKELSQALKSGERIKDVNTTSDANPVDITIVSPSH